MQADITSEDSVGAMMDQALLAYGGFDDIIVTAGVFFPPDKTGRISASQWRSTFEVNVRGGYVVAAAAREIWQAQGLPAALVLTTSVNAVVAKQGSLAYDSSKAAANHLVRELAIELAPLCGSMAWRRPRRQRQQLVPAGARHQLSQQVQSQL